MTKKKLTEEERDESYRRGMVIIYGGNEEAKLRKELEHERTRLDWILRNYVNTFHKGHEITRAHIDKELRQEKKKKGLIVTP